MIRLLLVVLVLLSLPAHSAVNGRFVRYSSPLLSSDNVFRLSVESGGKNLLPNVPVSAVTAFYPGNGSQNNVVTEKHWADLVDDRVDREGRAQRFGRPTPSGRALLHGETGAFIEIDLGAVASIDRLEALYDTKSPGVPRMFLILDENRNVVWSRIFPVDQPPFNAGVIEVKPTPGPGPGVGEVVPPGRPLPVSVVDLLPEREVPAPSDAADRLARFAARHSEDAVRKLAGEFFAKLDPSRPGLEPILALQRAGKSREALAAYRDRFFDKIAGMTNQWGHDYAETIYPGAADDLVRHISSTVGFGSLPGYTPPGVEFKKETLAFWFRFTPGAFPWTYVPDDAANEFRQRSAIQRGRPYPGGFPEEITPLQQVFINMAGANFKPGTLTRPLLSAYRAGGKAEHLKAWNELTWDWAENVQRDFEKNRMNLRDSFVKDHMEEVSFTLVEMARTDAAQKAFRTNVDPVAVARFLLACLDETPSYWRVARKTIFNHTFNAFLSAYRGYRGLDDFYAGQRLVDEMEDHLQRILSVSTTRDGSMIEVGDDGHLMMHLRMLSPVYFFEKEGVPYWTDADTVRQLKDLTGEMQRFQIRQLAPTGLGGRDHVCPHFAELWGVDTERGYGGMVNRSFFPVNEWLREPDTRAIVERVYGRGDGKRGVDEIAVAWKSAYEKVAAFYGDEPVPPVEMLSVWMPYSGLHYLRGGWDFTSPHGHMISYKKHSESGNSVNHPHLFSTAFSLTDFGYPLAWAMPLEIDGLPQDADYGRQTGGPGSKTERLTEAPETPIDARWFTDDWLDFAEGRYEGAYRFFAINYSGVPPLASKEVFRDATAGRWIIQFRPARTFVQIDRLQPGPDAAGREVTATLPLDFFLATGAEGEDRLAVEEKQARIRVEGSGLPAVTVRQISSVPPDYEERAPREWAPRHKLLPELKAGKKQQVLANFAVRDRFVSATIYDTREKAGDPELEITPVAAGPGLTGLDLRDPQSGATLKVRVTAAGAAALQAGPLAAEAEGIVLAEYQNEIRGLVLGAKSAAWQGKPLGGGKADFAFTVAGAKVEVTPIRRPLSPPEILPATAQFSEPFDLSFRVTDPEAVVLFTLDGSDPGPGAAGTKIYDKPVRISEDAFIKARTVRRDWLESGGKIVPLRSDGTDYSMISYAKFRHRTPLAPVENPPALQPGLDVEVFEDSWRNLFAHLSPQPVLEPVSKTTADVLLDPAGVEGLRRTEGPFGLRYSGYLAVPADGLYTFYAPPEFVRNIAEPGYDLRVWIDGEEWDPSAGWHGRGTWSVPLKKGFHRFAATFADARHSDKTCPEADLFMGYPAAHVVWKGDVPKLEVAGPGLPRQPLPADWLRRSAAANP